MPDIDQKNFRTALSRFATGVTVVTTRDSNGTPVGVTANSFNSVSLNPPMVLWSLAKTSKSMAAFSEADRFAIHILGSHQRDLSDRFASRGADKFAGMEVPTDSLPLLDEFAARFICRTAHQYDGGDHKIFVGEVLEIDVRDADPLLFLAGKYGEARRAPPENYEGIDPDKARVGAHSITHMIATLYAQITDRIQTRLAPISLNHKQLVILIAVGHQEQPKWSMIKQKVESAGMVNAEAEKDQLVGNNLLKEKDDALTITDDGRARYLEALSAIKALEEEYCAGLTRNELAEVQNALQSIIDRTGDGDMSIID